MLLSQIPSFCLASEVATSSSFKTEFFINMHINITYPTAIDYRSDFNGTLGLYVSFDQDVTAGANLESIQIYIVPDSQSLKSYLARTTIYGGGINFWKPTYDKYGHIVSPGSPEYNLTYAFTHINGTHSNWVNNTKHSDRAYLYVTVNLATTYGGGHDVFSIDHNTKNDELITISSVPGNNSNSSSFQLIVLVVGFPILIVAVVMIVFLFRRKIKRDLDRASWEQISTYSVNIKAGNDMGASSI